MIFALARLPQSIISLFGCNLGLQLRWYGEVESGRGFARHFLRLGHKSSSVGVDAYLHIAKILVSLPQPDASLGVFGPPFSLVFFCVSVQPELSPPVAHGRKEGHQKMALHGVLGMNPQRKEVGLALGQAEDLLDALSGVIAGENLLSFELLGGVYVCQ